MRDSIVGQVWHNVHYAAPAAGLSILIVILGMRRLRLFRWRHFPLGLHLVRWLPLACAALLLVQVGAGVVAPGAITQSQWHWSSPEGLKRARILHQLERLPCRHLVFVRYGRYHDTGDEWVYNGADIDGSRVVWARELNAQSNADLMRYFAGLPGLDGRTRPSIPEADPLPRRSPLPYAVRATRSPRYRGAALPG